MSLATHPLPSAQFGQLSAGGGDAATVRTLRAGQLSKHILLIRALTDAAAGHPGDDRLIRGYELLSSLQRTHRAEVDASVLHPHVGAWAVRCLERLYGVTEADGGLETDLGYLAAVAAATAIRAGVPFEIDVPVRDGEILLPGLGVGAASSGTKEAAVQSDGRGAQVTVSGGRIQVPPEPGHASGGWTPIRRLRASADGLEIAVDLDDLDPCRGYAYPEVAGRLTDAEAHEWGRVFADGWLILVRHHRPYAESLAAGLRSLVAQASPVPGRSISATSADAFGSIALSRPADAATFAVTLIHEFQHAKLGALIDLMPLYEARTGTRYYAPWRDDPRPLGGLLQGTYAFLGETDFWRVRRTVASAASAGLASFKFARWREQTALAADELAGSPELTDAGRRFVEGIRSTIRSWVSEAVPPGLAAQASDSAADHRGRWRVRNLNPAADAISILTSQWQRAEPASAEPVRTDVVSGPAPAATETARFRLRHLRLTDQDQFEAACAEASGADVAYLHGDYDQAARSYRAAIASAPDCVTNWAGLGLARLRGGDPATGRALLERPEVLLALYRALSDVGEDPDPEDLARWLDGTYRPGRRGISHE